MLSFKPQSDKHFLMNFLSALPPTDNLIIGKNQFNQPVIIHLALV